MTGRTFEYDDYPRGKPELLSRLDAWRERFPKFRATLFAIPAELTAEDWADWERRRDWLDISPHGFRHGRRECRQPLSDENRRTLDQICADDRWTRIWKAPWYGHGPEFVRELQQRDFALAIKSTEGIPYPAPDMRCWCITDATRRARATPQTRHIEAHPHYDGRRGRGKAKANKTGMQLAETWERAWSPDDEWARIADHLDPLPCRLILGCERQSLPGWTGLDNRPLGPHIEPWDGRAEQIPRSDHRCDVVVFGHIIEYFEDHEYEHLLLECWRVLRPGGLLRINEMDIRDPGRAFAPIGATGRRTRHTGTILSHPTAERIERALARVGFVFKRVNWGESEHEAAHPGLTSTDTRRGKWNRGRKVIWEAVKAIQIPNQNRRVRLHDPRARLRGRWALPTAPATTTETAQP